jgi:hypothetical protein
MSTRKYDNTELKEYASTHTIQECADHYNLNVNSTYTLLNQRKIDYKRVLNKKRNQYKKHISPESFWIAQRLGHLVPLTERDGWYMLAIGVLAYAKIDNCKDFPTKELFTEAIDIKDYMHCEMGNKIRRNGILI